MKLQLLNPTSRPIIIAQSFGENKLTLYKEIGMLGHNGVDFAYIQNNNVYAAHNGIVTYTGIEKNEGMGIVIRSKDKFDLIGYSEPHFIKTIYWHNVYPDGILVKVGQEVKAGQLIAKGDSTGYSTGPHLHFGLKPIYQGENDWTWDNVDQNNGYRGAIDPEPYFIPFQYDIKYGEMNEQVAKLQRFLEIKADGIYGEQTRKTVLDFQIKNVKLSWYEKNILRGKIVGPKTRLPLNSRYN